VDRLALRECPAITARRARRAQTLGVADTDPIVWAQAQGANVVDADGNLFVDLTAGFGVASVGHRHPEVVLAGQAQLGKLPHAMGDAFPDPTRILLLEKLSALSGLDRGILGCSGSDAVDAALKTARIATGRDGILAFEGSYHGLATGVLATTHYKAAAFVSPFRARLGKVVDHVPFGTIPQSLTRYGAVLVEPIQGRGGMRVGPPGWLADLQTRCSRDGALLILDEVFTGFGRTGSWFAAEFEGLRPDLLCLGKGMASGFPISACLGRAEVMDAWGASQGEALHTQTFLGNPVGCAMALACLQVLEREELPARAARVGATWAQALASFGDVRGRGLMLGLAVPNALVTSRKLLAEGWIALPAGLHGEVLGLTPPLTIAEDLLHAFLGALERCI
jgi:4-aminobutyrate aminotransferase-like enzyme